ncbi:MAG: CotH kinase family protein, partial [Planctomycetota bacterium]
MFLRKGLVIPVVAFTGLIAFVGFEFARAQFPGQGDQREILKEFDADQSGWLDQTERKAARESMQEQNAGFFSGRGPGGPGGRGPGGGGPGGGRGRGGPGGGGPGRGAAAEATPGPKIAKSSVEPAQGDLYDPSVLRTVFIDFENEDWEKELEDFHNTDVDVPATLTVDGKEYPNCGIRFRGASSYGHVPSGFKRSFNVSVDMVDEDQRLLGYKTLNLLNANGDDTLMSTVLYSQIARQYMPAPKANFVRLVINDEYWGVYTNVQQFNKQFLSENYGTTKGARWKVNGSPRGGGGLDYRGDDPSYYGHPYEQKSGGKKSLGKLIEFCRILDETPTDQLPDALEAICDVDELLWFLTLDVGLMNSDGYWVRASDYSIYLDEEDKFHFIPHDMNEAFRPSRGGPGGGRGGPGGGRGGPGGGGPGFGGGFGGGPGVGGGPGFGGPGGGGPGFGGPDGGGRGFGGGPDGGRGFGGPDRGRGLGGERDTRRPEGDRDFGERSDDRGGRSDRGGRGDERGGREGQGRGTDRGGPRGPGGGGFGGGDSTSSIAGLDPFVSMTDRDKPLRSKLLAVPKYREQYLQNLKTLAQNSLNWTKLGPVIEAHAKLIDESVKSETRSMTSYQAFSSSVATQQANAETANPFGRSRVSLKA